MHSFFEVLGVILHVVGCDVEDFSCRGWCFVEHDNC